MRLNSQSLENRKQWEAAGYHLPMFDRETMITKTKQHPFWIHFGAGNIFRAFQANAVQKLLNTGVLDRGIIVAEGFDYDIIRKMNRPQEDMTLLVTLKADGTVEKTVIGSIAESCILDAEDTKEYERLKEIFMQDSLQMASFTITEKGYCLLDGEGKPLEAVASDFKKGPQKPSSYIGKVTSLLYTRYLHGEKPIALVSMDNCSHNGEKLHDAILAFAQEWSRHGLCEAGFLSYIENPKKVSFPWTMIDKITPRPDASVEKLLKADGIEGLEAVVTSKNTYVASFVNAEECEYLVLEDWFPNGRPALEEAGFLFTDRKTVEQVEKMKVCTCLNPLHTALAVFGCLLGYEKISEEMQVAELVQLVEGIGYKEGLPVVVNPGILNPKEFLDTVIKVRLPNPFMPDTPQRIATDTSQKLAIRFGETIKNYMADSKKSTASLKLIPLVFAGWLRYLMAVDDNGTAFKLSPDPLLDTVCPVVSAFQLGENKHMEETVEPLLKNRTIFGVDLYEAGLAELVCQYLKELTAGIGAVRETLKKYTKE